MRLSAQEGAAKGCDRNFSRLGDAQRPLIE
jgi:hypothetical protein